MQTIKKMAVLDVILRAQPSIRIQKMPYGIRPYVCLAKNNVSCLLGPLPERGHCLYKWTSAFGTQGIIRTQELSELPVFVHELPCRPSA